MPLAWSSSGIISNSLTTDSPFADINRGSVIATIPPGAYGTGARLIFAMAVRTGDNQFGSGLAPWHTVTFSGGASTKTVMSRLTDGNSTSFGTAQRTYNTQIQVYQPSGWSFDSGTTITVTSKLPTTWRVTNGSLSQFVTVNNTPNIVGNGTSWLTELSIGQTIWIGSVLEGQIATITDDTHMALNVSIPLSGSASCFASETEQGPWVAALQTFDQLLPIPPVNTSIPHPGENGNVAYILTTPTVIDHWTSTSFSGNFGDLDLNVVPGNRNLGMYLAADPNCVEGWGIVTGVRTTGLGFTGDLVNGNPNWTTVATQASGTWPVYTSMSHWTRSGSDTSMTWSGIPPTTKGQSSVVIFPEGGLTPGISAINRGYVIG